MMRSRFEHTGDVFFFTFKQSTNGKAFKFLTIALPLIIFAICFLINVIPVMINEEEEISPVEKVYLVDNTGTEYFGDVFIELYDKDYYANMTVVTYSGVSAEDVCEEISADETGTFLIEAELIDDEEVPYFSVTAIIPDWCTLSEDEYGEVLSLAGTCMDSLKVATAGIDYESLVYLSSYVYTDVLEAGETAETFGSYMIKALAPMLIMLVVYLMVILYGQSIGKVVIAEKNSKLMETLLISIQPEALIAGKIIAMTLIALMQMFLWIIGGVAGFAAGHGVARLIDESAGSFVIDAVKMVMESSSAFSPAAILLSLLALVFGFAFYCILSGLIASFAGKAEELASSTGIYNMLVVIGFFGAYFPLMSEVSVSLHMAIRIIPFTSAFALMPDILVGNAGILEGTLELLVLVAVDVLLVIATGKIYKARVFFTGSSPFALGKK